ncbi:AAA family ATPase [Schaedlerella arabinosiphila]|uniref:AAA family ATPase n=1 Tax=Schaedlerella arabinosiphila TaxID=2044587 RepID=A0A9X5H8T3_9FIRM|nr:hypothetical protein C824_003458 [Schaedlerella arabinosiphila]NDO72084.1 AAA family ATPase [Schaedlerella arabinosiphila]
MLFKLFKQYLLKENIAPDHIIEIAFDDRRNKKLRDPDNCLEYVDSKILDQDMHYILLDEVQLMAEFEDVLNSFLHMECVDVYVTGSNSKFLSSDIKPLQQPVKLKKQDSPELLKTHFVILDYSSKLDEDFPLPMPPDIAHLSLCILVPTHIVTAWQQSRHEESPISMHPYRQST